MTLTTCIRKAGEYLQPDDRSQILLRAREMRGEGQSARDAGVSAITEQAAAVQQLLDQAEAELAKAQAATAKHQAARDDMFPEDFADDDDTVETKRAVNSKGDAEMGGNVNSAGLTISGTKQGLKNFWDWFGASEAVDDDGRPLVMYHSTRADINRFETGRATTNNYGLLGDVDVRRAGIFVTPDASFSQEYLRSGDGQNVMQVYLKTENPLDLRGGLSEADEATLERGGVNTRAIHNIQNHWELFDAGDDGKSEFVDALRELGYDGAIFHEDRSDGGRATTYAAFSPGQLKSAIGNRGTFDPGSDDITKSAERTDTPEFKKWFGDSKVIDQIIGGPAVVYHGTGSDITAFRKAGITWVSLSPYLANAYANYRGRNASGNVIPLYAKAERPFDAGNDSADISIEGLLAMAYRQATESGRKLDKRAVQRAIDATVAEWQRQGLGSKNTWITDHWMSSGASGLAMLKNALQEMGFDSIALREEGVPTWAVFTPEQVKSAIGNSGAFDPASSDITQSAARAPLWYSQLQRAIDQAPDRLATMSAAQWQQWLKANAAKMGVKQDEITWSGIEDYLQLRGKDKLSREELAGWVEQNGVKVEETVLGGERYKIVETEEGEFDVLDVLRPIRGEPRVLFTGSTREQAEEYMEEVSTETDRHDPRYGQYTLPGGTNYREVLLTLPAQRDARDAHAAYLAELRRKYPGTIAQRMLNQTPAETRELERLANAMHKESGAPEYKSNHWDEAGVLAHIRINDRIDAGGRKVLFIEELQSDHGADMRKQRAAIERAVDSYFQGIVERMKKAGVLEVVCD